MRTLPALRLSRSPLVYVLAQIKIAPILQMGEFVPKIQERLRHAGFPLFRTSTVQEILIGPRPAVKMGERWLFSSKEGTHTVVLAKDFVVLATSQYAVFEEFVEKFAIVLETVGGEADVALSDRMGLRYVDLIRTQSGENLNEYLQPGLHGLSADALGASRVLHQTQISAVTDMGQLVVRLWQANDGRFLPPDLEGDDVKFNVSLTKDELVTILDIDHFSIEERSFVVKDLVSALWRLHEGPDRAFRAMTTDDARNRWGAEPAR
jgi:uncharacterized protein (TIGR04255 family)